MNLHHNNDGDPRHAAGSACTTTPGSRLPPITRRPTTEHHVGKVVWVDLASPDPEIAKRFYGKLFGWSFYSGPNEVGYVTVFFRDHLIGGIISHR